MEKRGIIIADRDGEYREEMAAFFQDAGYTVETTDSAVHVLCSILEKQTPVLLLGSNFDRKICSADLIHLLKKCNRNLHVIMVSDQMPLPEARQVRQEGIFYHALKPASPADTEEISQAVNCAFGKETESAVTSGKTDASLDDVCNCSTRPDEGRNPADTIWWFVALAVLVLVTSYFGLVAGESASQGNTLGIWLFLGFCAAIIVTQLLPIFGIDLPLPLPRERAKQEGDSRKKN